VTLPDIDDGIPQYLYDRFAYALGEEAYNLYVYWSHCCSRDDTFVEPAPAVDRHIQDGTLILDTRPLGWEWERN